MRPTISAIVLLTLPSVAMASDMSGVATLLAMIFVVGPWVLLNLVALVILAFKRRYSSRSFSVNHSLLVAAGPALGILLALIDFSGSYHTTDRNISLAILFGLLLLACLPIVVHRFQQHA
jgi:hypothetical protein